MKPQPTTSEKWVWFWQGVALAGLGLMVWFFAGMPLEAKAQMFPSDAITIGEDLHTATAAVQVFATSTEARTIWYVAVSCNAVGDIAVYEGPFKAQPVDGNYIDTEGVVNNEQQWGAWEWHEGKDIWITKVGQSQCHVNLTYSPRVASTTNATTRGEIATVEGFAYADVITIFLLLMIFTLLLFADLRNAIFRKPVVAKVIKEYQQK